VDDHDFGGSGSGQVEKSLDSTNYVVAPSPAQAQGTSGTKNDLDQPSTTSTGGKNPDDYEG